MKNKKFLKSAALALGTVASVAAPIAAVVSCGSSTDYSHTVVIKYTWAANGAQVKALQPVVDYYNKNVKGANDFDVKLVHVEGGYGKAIELDRMDMGMNNMNPVADAIIDYPDSLGVLQEKALDFGSGIESEFETGYTTTQLEGQKNAGVFSLPLAKSTEMLSIDVPFMAALQDAKIINVTDADLKNAIVAYKADKDNAKELENVTKKFALKAGTTEPEVEISTDVLKDYNKLFEAGDAISNAITQTHGASAKLHIIGEDSPTNLVYQLFNAKEDLNKDDKFLFHSNGDGTFDYSALKDASTPEAKVLTGILGELNDHVKTGSLVLNGGGAYSSSDFINHDLPFVIGSTAGYDHNYKGQAAFGVKSGTDVVKFEGYNKELVSPSKALAADGAVAMTADSYHNGVYVAGAGHNGSNHEIAVPSAEADVITKALKAPGQGVALKQVGKTASLDAAAKTDKATSGNYAYDVVAGAKVSVTPGKDATHVNADEVLSLGAPVRSESSTTGTPIAQNQILSQGPSIIGIQHGGEKDAQTIKFMKWFFGKTSTIVGADGNKATPIDVFDKASGYITPVIDAFDAENRSKYTGGNLVAFDAFASVTIGGTPFDNPVTKHSSAIRKSLETSVKTIYTKSNGGTAYADAASIYKDVAAKLHMELSNN